jgi:hypothetical protein
METLKIDPTQSTWIRLPRVGLMSWGHYQNNNNNNKDFSFNYLNPLFNK